MSFDRNVDLEKRFIPGEPLSLRRRSSGGKEFHSTGAEYWKDRFRIVESDEFRRPGAARWLNGKEIGEI